MRNMVLGAALSLAVCFQIWGVNAAHAGTAEQNVTISGTSSSGSNGNEVLNNQVPTLMPTIQQGSAPLGPVKWKRVAGTAYDIGVGADGTAWVVGKNNTIWRMTFGSWNKINGYASAISVDPQGNAWVITRNGAINRFDGKKWVKVPGIAYDLDVGADGTAWHVGTNNSIWRMVNGSWKRIAGSATKIAVGPDGNAWVIDPKGGIFRYDGKGWQRVQGQAYDIGVSANGTVWHIGNGNTIYRMKTDSNWEHIRGSAAVIAGANGPKAWVINSAHEIFAQE